MKEIEKINAQIKELEREFGQTHMEINRLKKADNPNKEILEELKQKRKNIKKRIELLTDYKTKLQLNLIKPKTKTKPKKHTVYIEDLYKEITNQYPEMTNIINDKIRMHKTIKDLQKTAKLLRDDLKELEYIKEPGQKVALKIIEIKQKLKEMNKQLKQLNQYNSLKNQSEERINKNTTEEKENPKELTYVDYQLIAMINMNKLDQLTSNQLFTQYSIIIYSALPNKVELCENIINHIVNKNQDEELMRKITIFNKNFIRSSKNSKKEEDLLNYIRDINKKNNTFKVNLAIKSGEEEILYDRYKELFTEQNEEAIKIILNNEPIVKEILRLINNTRLNDREIIEQIKIKCRYDAKKLTEYIEKMLQKINIDQSNDEVEHIGIVKRDKKYNYIIYDKKKYPVSNRYYLEGDVISFKMYGKHAFANKIIDRSKTKFICEAKMEKGELKLIPFSSDHRIPFNFDIKEYKYIVDGDRVLIELSKELISGKYNGKFKELICNSRDMDSTIKTLCAMYEFPIEFSNEALDELKNIPLRVFEKDMVNRIDLRNEIFFTIDGSDTKDRDDAISIKRLPNGHYCLKVAISHVSHYIKPTSVIYKEALDRGTSVYTPGAVNPQLPQQITNGICSLNEKVDRLVKVTEMIFNEEGIIVDSKIYDGVINSRKAFTYEEVNEYLKDAQKSDKSPLYNKLIISEELSSKINKLKHSKGYLKLLSEEVYYQVDENKNIKFLREREAGKSEEIIENFMVSANNIQASTAVSNDLWFIYRNHEEADGSRIANAFKKIKRLNVIDKSVLENCKNLSEVLNVLPNDINKYIISRIVLRSLCKAHYSVNNMGHAGLCSKAYSHTTSPIRRGPDLVNQTILDLVENNQIVIETFNAETLTELSSHFSERERASDKLEIAAEAIKVFDYYNNNDIKELKMTIVDIDHDKATIKAKGFPEGSLPIENISQTAYFDPARNIIRQTDTNKCYRIGEKISVRPINVNNLGIIYEMVNKEQKKTYVKTRTNQKMYPSSRTKNN